MEDHISNRLLNFRHYAIPWINSLISLNKKKFLEIGVGTGCTTVALAEQGCYLTCIDVDNACIEIVNTAGEVEQ